MDSKEILKDLVSFNTINDKENKCIIDYFEKYLKKLGFKTEYKSNCLVMSNKKDCNIGFLGHTDTVPCSNDWLCNPFELTQIDDKLYGLGTCDMKGSIAAILSAVSKVDFNKLNKGIKLFFTYDEEINFSGITELINKKVVFPNTVIIGEPTNNEIINASKGLLEIRLIFKGVPSHSSTPEEGVNAIEKGIEFISELKDYYKKLKKEIINSKSITMNIGMINGGQSINVVPDRCEVLIDFRTVFEKQNKDIIKMINNSDIEYEIINNINPFTSDSKNIKMSDYMTEASFLTSENRYILGVGPNNSHKKNEYITIDSLNKLEKQYIELLKENCKE